MIPIITGSAQTPSKHTLTTQQLITQVMVKMAKTWKLVIYQSTILKKTEKEMT